MRRVKATVLLTKEGKVGEAYTGDRVLRDVADAYASEVSGYIEVPLKKGTSRAKGNGLEIIVAKAFSTWLYGRDDVLKRTPLSGGWGSGKLGDITMDPALAMELGIKTPPKIYVECKNREGVLDESFWRYLATGTPSTIGDWIGDTYAKAAKLKQMPFLILKGRGTEPFVFVIQTKAFPLASTHWARMGLASMPQPGDGDGSYADWCTFFPLSTLRVFYGPAVIAELKG